jgi:hypothetical protein
VRRPGILAAAGTRVRLAVVGAAASYGHYVLAAMFECLQAGANRRCCVVHYPVV